MITENKNLIKLGWNSHFETEAAKEDLTTLFAARVTKTHRGHVVVSTITDEYLLLIAEKGLRSLEEQPTVGDWLLLDKKDHIPVKLLPRTSVLKRMGPGQEVKVQPIAANIDTLLIVASCNSEFNLNRLERYVCLAIEAGVKFAVILTKADKTDDVNKYVEQAKDLHEGLEVIPVNAKDLESVASLKRFFIKGTSTVMLGSSGVGKTTLLNSVNGSKLDKVGSIREVDSKGRHTTTTRTLHILPSGAILIDVPGIRELQLYGSLTGIQNAFNDIALLTTQCKFSDCKHINEPGCAVKYALENNEIDERRLKNYLKLVEENNSNVETVKEKNKRKRKGKKSYTKKK